MDAKKKIIYVSHDARFAGAQLLSLNIIKALKENFAFDIAMICIEGGELLPEFKKYSSVFCLQGVYYTPEKLIKNLSLSGYQTALCNTAITGDLVEIISKNGIKVISLIHELPGVIRAFAAEEKVRKIAQFAEKVVFPSQYIYDKLRSIVNLDETKRIILPQGVFNHNPYKSNIQQARKELREKLRLPLGSKIVLAVGYAHERKGIDLFAEISHLVKMENKNIHFVWVGDKDVNFMNRIPKVYRDTLIFINATTEIGLYNAGADLYLMTSREDPFPSVVLEAMDVQVPVVGFENAGGFQDVVTDETGELVEFLNTHKMAQKVLELISDEDKRLKKGIQGQKLIEEKFGFHNYIYSLLELLGYPFKKVSVIIPNYNYGRYLPRRIESILKQTYPIYEIIFLDDGSTDNSVRIFNHFFSNNFRKHLRLNTKFNEANMGSVFKQWVTGISLATGEYIWIAEADDLCSETFLEEVMQGFSLPEVVLSYVQSKQMDEYGIITADNYLPYTNDIDTEKWKTFYSRKGTDEIRDSLVVKNTIPNVSATIFKKLDIEEIKDQLQQFNVAGDWFFYVWILQKGNIYFNPKSLNFHRRHTNSVTITNEKLIHYKEVVSMQNYILNSFEVDNISREKVYKYRTVLKEFFGL
jgi:glycosyltransferase involved in cell wall biosynthesis